LRSGLFGGLEVHMGDHDLLDYCTFTLQVVNDAQTVRVNTACWKGHTTRRILSKL